MEIAVNEPNYEVIAVNEPNYFVIAVNEPNYEVIVNRIGFMYRGFITVEQVYCAIC